MSNTREETEGKENYTVEEICQALKDANGILTSAAAKLGCSRMTVYNYMEKYPEIKEVYQQESERLVDVGESKLWKVVTNEQHKDHYRSVEFLLKTKGRHRGYSEKVEYNLNMLGSAAERLGLGKLDMDKLTLDEARMLAELVEKAYEDE